MAKGKKTGGKNFEAGHEVRRPASPPEVRQLGLLTKAEALKCLSKFLKYNIEELEVLLKDKKMSAMDHWAGRIVLNGIKNGDSVRLNFMLDRLIGKVTDKVEHSLPRPLVIEYEDGTKTIAGYKRDD